MQNIQENRKNMEYEVGAWEGIGLLDCRSHVLTTG